MRLKTTRPGRLDEINTLLRRGDISAQEALKFAVELRRRKPAPDGVGAAVDQVAEEARAERVQGVLHELNSLVGLNIVKRHVREIRAFTAIGLKRRALGLQSDAIGLHMIFSGNPGTGKTTVARLLGRLFKEMGLLPRGHMVEVERADLVGEYIGHTAQKTRDVVKKALGGVLFIDEAYSLARGGEKDFGKESIDCLVRSMEEHRGELLLILAGYPVEMEWFLAQNPGLRSRFPMIITFPDYTADELFAIGEGMWHMRQYELTREAQAFFQQVLRRSDWNDGGEAGNARAVRNLVERSLRCQAVRLMGQRSQTREQLLAIHRTDLEEALKHLD